MPSFPFQRQPFLTPKNANKAWRYKEGPCTLYYLEFSVSILQHDATTYKGMTFNTLFTCSFNNFVVGVESVEVVDVLGECAQIAWNFSVPTSSSNVRGAILVRPEVFGVCYWKRTQTFSEATCKDTKGRCYILNFNLIDQGHSFVNIQPI